MDASLVVKRFIHFDVASIISSMGHREDKIIEARETIQAAIIQNPNSNLFEDLTKILKEGCEEDLIRFIQQYFSMLPVGIRWKIVVALRSLRTRLTTNTIEETTSITGQEIMVDIVHDWRIGKVSPSQLFSSLDQIGNDRAKATVNMVLTNAGYNATPSFRDFQTSQRTIVDIEDINMWACHHIAPDWSEQSSVRIFSATAEEIIVIAPTGKFHRSGVISSLQPISTPNNMNIWWEHVPYVTNIALRRGRQIHEENIITIGDSISCTGHALLVDSVLSVDAVSSYYQADGRAVLQMVVLVEGRRESGALNHSGLLMPIEDCDGLSEFESDEIHANNPDDGTNEICPPIVAVERKYYCLFATVIPGDIVNIDSIAAVHSYLLVDQRPVAVKCMSSHQAIVFGSNALLLTIQTVNSRLPHLDAIVAHRHTISNLVQGDHAHQGDANITAVDYSYEAEVLASGDSHGRLCLWAPATASRQCDTLTNTTQELRLAGEPFQLCKEGEAIQHVTISASGRHICVSLWDRLFLVGVNDEQGMWCNLYVRSVLDVVTSCHAKYTCYFTSDHIRIWRLMKMSAGNKTQVKSGDEPMMVHTGITATSWVHKNVDSISHRKLDICLRDDEATQRVSNTTIVDDDCNLAGRILTSPQSPLRPLINSLNWLQWATPPTSPPPAPPCSPTCASSTTRPSTVTQLYSGSACHAQILSHYHPSPIETQSCRMNIEGIAEDIASSTSPRARGPDDLFWPNRSNNITASDDTCLRTMLSLFSSDSSILFRSIKPFLSVYCAISQPQVPLGLVAAALEMEMHELQQLIDETNLRHIMTVSNTQALSMRTGHEMLPHWLTSFSPRRMCHEFWLDISNGHNYLCVLYLRFCGNKSVAVESTWQDYLRTYGTNHLRKSNRGLRKLTHHIRKLDETANIKDTLPRQLGYISGLQEIYARRVGLKGRLPAELGELNQLRVLSMGNNQLCGLLPPELGQLNNLQRIVLHQNNFCGEVPAVLGELGCIVNLAGNPLLENGSDVPQSERQALVDLFGACKGLNWTNKSMWCTAEHVAMWYKVGVLSSHVHSIVMSSNGMDGRLPTSISELRHLRMIELATMPALVGSIPPQLCTIVSLRRLCICRCGLTGKIPHEIGMLTALEELQLFGNHLTGSIPESMGKLIGLKLLSLGEYTGGNDFTSNSLPSCLSSLKSLEALFMANCNLKGALPTWLGELTELRQLDLQRNMLTGSLPESIGQLSNLLYLNLKDNEALGGQLPLPQLALLTKLNRLSLVHCNFQGADAAVASLQTLLPRCKIWL